MSSVRGTISVDVAFTDSTTVSGAQSLKTIVLRDATEYTTGKVAVASGTVGTAAQTLSFSSYRDASGSLVDFSTGSRVAFQCVGATGYFLLSSLPVQIIGAHSSGGVSLCDIPSSFASPSGYRVQTLSGTASYTLVMYGT
jgi:hypothetical protein